MFERFTRDARAVVLRAEAEARAAGAATIDAEHLLLALARTGPVAGVLAEAGLDHDGAAAALAEEEDASLAAVGISAAAFGAPAPRPRRGALRAGASTKAALERSLRSAVARRHRRLDSRHILLGVLDAEHGRVPRALACADVERAALAAAVDRLPAPDGP